MLSTIDGILMINIRHIQILSDHTTYYYFYCNIINIIGPYKT